MMTRLLAHGFQWKRGYRSGSKSTLDIRVVKIVVNFFFKHLLDPKNFYKKN